MTQIVGAPMAQPVSTRLTLPPWCLRVSSPSQNPRHSSTKHAPACHGRKVETLRPLSLSLMAPVVYEPGKGGGGGHPIPYPVSYHPAPYVEPFGYRAQHPSMVFPSHAHAQHHHQHAHHHQHQHPLRRQQVMVSPPGPVMHSSAHGGMINAAGPSPLMVLGWAANSARHPGSAPSYPDAHAYSSSSSGGSSRSGSSAALSNGGGGPAPSLILGEGMGLSRARIDETSSTASSGSSAREGTSQVSAPKKRLRLSSEERLQRRCARPCLEEVGGSIEGVPTVSRPISVT
jgi:hypothetical protein